MVEMNSVKEANEGGFDEGVLWSVTPRHLVEGGWRQAGLSPSHGSRSTFGHHAVPQLSGSGRIRVMADMDNGVEQLTSEHCYLYITRRVVPAPPTPSPGHFGFIVSQPRK
jgi:hypothetical protein